MRKMVKPLLVLVCLASAALPAQAQGRTEAEVSGASQMLAHRALLDRYCVTCHSERLKIAGLALDGVDLADVSQDGAIWEKVVHKLRGGLMPPIGRPRPEPAEYDQFASFLEGSLDRVAAANPNPGPRTAFHRMNGAEYENAVRDLLALAIDGDELLPADDASYGFDNIAGVLKVNQARMERYLSAARIISRLAVGAPVSLPAVDTFKVSPDLTLPQYDRIEGLPFGTRGGTRIEYYFREDAEYLIETELMCPSQGSGDLDCDGGAGFTDDHQLEVTVDGARVALFDLPSKPAAALGAGFGETLSVRVPVSAGPHVVGATFFRLSAVEPIQAGYRLPLIKPQVYHEMTMKLTAPFVDRVTISGPFEAVGPGDTPSRRAVFVCRPAEPADERACAETILTKLARRAYRREVTESDLEGLLTFFERGRTESGFEAGIEQALAALLMSPEFWYRSETLPLDLEAGSTYEISDVELASSLSFFLWSSIPDDELLNVALGGTLRDPVVIERQVRRMLADPRSESLTRNFAGQWLQLRNLPAVQPNNAIFPNFDESLRQAMQKEAELFFDSIVREDRSALELVTATYTFVNERLAWHYGMPGISGSHFRRVSLADDSPRIGVLGKGSILTLTSHATRTSPVKRGKWVLDNIIGAPPPPPPPNVPALEESQGEEPSTLREQMEQHRRNPVCAGCHSTIDPAGFALENFDAIGRYRTIDRESNKPVNPAGMLPDGVEFDSLGSFRAAVMTHPERFIITMTEKLLTYALGRGLEYYDMPAIRAIVRDAAEDGYQFSSIVRGIVQSKPFQMRGVAQTPDRGVDVARR